MTWKYKRTPAGMPKRGEPTIGLRETVSARLQLLEELTVCVPTVKEGSMQETVQTMFWNIVIIFRKNRLQ